MPVYEYRCTKGHTFDVIQRMSEDPISKCEICGKSAQRVLHAPAIHFKGTGFHNTDYGTKKRPRDGDKSDAASTSTGDAGAGKGSTDSGSSSGATDGATPKVKEATPTDTARRATGP